MQERFPPPNSLRIGKIVGFYGLQGDVKVRPASEDPDWIHAVSQLQLVWPGKKIMDVKIRKAWQHDRLVILRFEEYESRTRVEAFLGAELYAKLEDLPALGPEEYRVDDLIGLKVLDMSTHCEKGIVRDILSSGGGDYLEIRTPHSKQTALVPFNEHFFPKVDLQSQTIYVNKISDFLEELDKPENPKPS